MISRMILRKCKNTNNIGLVWPADKAFNRKRLASSTAQFDGEISSLYNSIAENHRHEKGPWNLILKKLQSKYHNNNNEELKIIDIASGPGEPACTIAKSYPKATVFSTDISIDMHKISSIQSINIKNLKSIVLDAQDLSIFSTNSIDAITCCYGFMFPEDKIKCLSEVYRVLKPGGILISTHWIQLDGMFICKAILKTMYEFQKNSLPPKSSINPMSLAEPNLFNNICIQGGFKKENIEVEQSSHPFNLGNDPEYQYKLITLPIRSIIDELQCHTIAKKVYKNIVNQYTVYDEKTKNLILPNNVFIMTTIIK